MQVNNQAIEFIFEYSKNKDLERIDDPRLARVTMNRAEPWSSPSEVTVNWTNQLP